MISSKILFTLIWFGSGALSTAFYIKLVETGEDDEIDRVIVFLGGLFSFFKVILVIIVWLLARLVLFLTKKPKNEK